MSPRAPLEKEIIAKLESNDAIVTQDGGPSGPATFLHVHTPHPTRGTELTATIMLRDNEVVVLLPIPYYYSNVREMVFGLAKAHGFPTRESR